jgi:hypothetical protein
VDHGILEVPWKFSDLPQVVSRVYDGDTFFHAAQFFSRTYTRVSREVDDPPVLESQRQASVTVIRELVGFYLQGRTPVPEGQSSADYVAAFNNVQTNNQWIAEEKLWADALSVACGFEFFES